MALSITHEICTFLLHCVEIVAVVIVVIGIMFAIAFHRMTKD